MTSAGQKPYAVLQYVRVPWDRVLNPIQTRVLSRIFPGSPRFSPRVEGLDEAIARFHDGKDRGLDTRKWKDAPTPNFETRLHKGQPYLASTTRTGNFPFFVGERIKQMSLHDPQDFVRLLDTIASETEEVSKVDYRKYIPHERLLISYHRWFHPAHLAMKKEHPRIIVPPLLLYLTIKDAEGLLKRFGIPGSYTVTRGDSILEEMAPKSGMEETTSPQEAEWRPDAQADTDTVRKRHGEKE